MAVIPTSSETFDTRFVPFTGARLKLVQSCRVADCPDELVTYRAQARRGEAIVHQGAAFDGLYVVRSGSCKSVRVASNGVGQVVGHHIVDDVFGLQSVFTASYDSTLVALEQSVVWRLGWTRIKTFADREKAFHTDLSALMFNEISREREAVVVLGALRADQRVAWFLLDLLDRYRARGHTCSTFHLQLSRQDIGSRLGLTQETVSRIFSRFHQVGLLHVRSRTISVIDSFGLLSILQTIPG